ncbi:MAG: S8 family peptidase [Bacteroidota bacterium]
MITTKISYFAVIALSLILIQSASAQTNQPSADLVLQKLAPEFIGELTSKKVKFRSAKALVLSRPLFSESQSLTDQDGLYDCVIRTIAKPSPQLLAKSNSAIPNFVTARLTLDEMIELASDPTIEKIYPGGILYPNNNVANGMTGADLVKSGAVNSTIYDGTGVIILIIDSGIDYKHLDFRDPADTTKSRILYIWDQTLTKAGAELTPAGRDATNFSGLTYGVEYSNANLNNEIDGTPAGFVRTQDTFGHGTHVAGSAAGNGNSLSSQKYSGIATKADIVVVKAGNSSFTTVNLINALTYARQLSATEGKPVVVNMSLGGQQHAHDGTRDLDIAVDNFTSSGNGRVAVIAAGNDGSSALHNSGTVGANDSVSFNIFVPDFIPRSGASNDYFLFETWWEDNSDYSVKITNSFFDEYRAVDGFVGTNSYTNHGFVYIDNGVSSDHTNGDQRTSIQIYDGSSLKPPLSGNWTITLINNSGSAKSFHGWMFGNTLKAVLTGGNSDYTIGSPGTASSAVTVGSYASRWNWHADNNSNVGFGTTTLADDISSFSSVGPRRDNVQKPDIAAPGQGIISSRSINSTIPDSTKVDTYYRVNFGTSMATPITAGAAALLLDHNPSLSAAQVKSYLTANTFTDSYTGTSLPDNQWGYGKLNIFNALGKAVNSATVNHSEIFTYDAWSALSSVNIAPNEKIAVKFSPANSGRISGGLFHPYTDVNISSPMNLEIWSDNAGSPGTKLGSTVSYPYQNISVHSWNYVNLESAGVTLVGGNHYHLVMYYTAGTNFQIYAEAGSVDNRSFLHNGVSWGLMNSDVKVRPVVITTEAALPVELISFTATAQPKTAELRWKTATEVNNHGFEVERRAMDNGQLKIDNWSRAGFVEGNGTSNSPNDYVYTDRGMATGKYAYRLKQIDRDGKFEYSQEVEVTIGGVPTVFALEQNYPNPFNPSTVIGYQIPVYSNVSLRVYDAIGREVATLVNEAKEAGFYTATFDGSKLSSGMYIARLTSAGKSQTRKLLIMK